MVKETSAVELLRGLSAEEIRCRLAELGAEERALRTLLRVALQAQTGKKALKGRSEKSPVGTDDDSHQAAMDSGKLANR